MIHDMSPGLQCQLNLFALHECPLFFRLESLLSLLKKFFLVKKREFITRNKVL